MPSEANPWNGKNVHSLSSSVESTGFILILQDLAPLPSLIRGARKANCIQGVVRIRLLFLEIKGLNRSWAAVSQAQDH